MNTTSMQQTVFTVSQLNQLVKEVLENTFRSILIEGEISNVMLSRSKHWYFSLKDANAQVRCVLFHHHAADLTPKDGMSVVVRAEVSLYQNRGDFQLIVSELKDVGLGKLQRAFEQLKAKLEQQGLFDAIHKKPLPVFPKCIGVVTSASGAAVHDVLTVLKRRYPIASVVVYPSLVQGAEAAAQLVKAIQKANIRRECDVLLLCRGGGTLEDLWPFNEAVVAQTIFASAIPIITGIGHEVDVTIADFVADKRAPTPSVAAELAVPDQKELMEKLRHEAKLLGHSLLESIQQRKKQLKWLLFRLGKSEPRAKLRQQTQRLDQLTHQLILIQKQLLQRKQWQWDKWSQRLKAFNPKATLGRGYAMVMNGDGQLLRHDAAEIVEGNTIHVQLVDKQLRCLIQAVHPETI